MLGVILTYSSFFEFVNYQIDNFRKNIKVPFKIYFVDNSLTKDHKQEDFEGIDVYIYSLHQGIPSNRHQESVNLGLENAWKDCDCFLIIDNDMIFLDDWTPPLNVQYFPQSRSLPSKVNYAWLNLLFYWKDDRLKKFSFLPNCDSGASFHYYLNDGCKCEEIIQLDIPNYSYLKEYQINYIELCEKYSIKPFYEIFKINGSHIFHFRALSNWTRYPEKFMEDKRNLILENMKNL